MLPNCWFLLTSSFNQILPRLIIYMKKIIDSDWLRAVQFKCNTSAKSVTPVQMATKIFQTLFRRNLENAKYGFRRLFGCSESYPKLTRRPSKVTQECWRPHQEFRRFPIIKRRFRGYCRRLTEDFRRLTKVAEDGPKVFEIANIFGKLKIFIVGPWYFLSLNSFVIFFFMYIINK